MPKIAASAMRSQDESSTAPNTEPLPPARATAPSTMSSSTKNVMISVPASHHPRGKNTTAAATEPTVPTAVTASGVTPARARLVPSGTSAREMEARAWMFSTLVGCPFRFRARGGAGGPTAHDTGRRAAGPALRAAPRPRHVGRPVPALVSRAR